MRKDDLLTSLTLNSNGITNSNGFIKPVTNTLLQTTSNQQHQYDKMNHQLNKLLTLNRNENDLNQQQQQHFYESVDTLELPHKNNILSGQNSCNFKINNKNVLYNINNSSNSHNSNDFNTTSTSSSTTSSASSTNQFIRQMSQQQFQQQKQFNLLTAIQQTKNGSWSPDSAYYSSIPNYAYNNLLQHQQHQHQLQSSQQLQSNQRDAFNFNFLNQNEHLLLNDNFKSQFV